MGSPWRNLCQQRHDVVRHDRVNEGRAQAHPEQDIVLQQRRSASDAHDQQQRVPKRSPRRIWPKRSPAAICCERTAPVPVLSGSPHNLNTAARVWGVVACRLSSPRQNRSPRFGPLLPRETRPLSRSSGTRCCLDRRSCWPGAVACRHWRGRRCMRRWSRWWTSVARICWT